MGSTFSARTMSLEKQEDTAKTVLIIEDEESLRLAVCKVLKRRGFRVLEAADGRAGVDLFQAHAAAIDVVLLDLTLPRLSGREVLSEMRRIRPNVRVVLTTAYSENSWRSQGEPPFWGFIRKPYQVNELVDLLREACGEEGELRDQRL